MSRIEAIANYFQNVFVANAELSEGANRLNALAKWFLDLLRNAIIVGALQYFAKKTNSQAMDIIATLGLCTLFAYCISYTRVFFRPFHCLANQRLGQTLDSIADRMLFIIISILVVGVVQFAVNEIASAQFK
jgi:hypothetical protein